MSSIKRLHFGLIGCGEIGLQNAQALKETRNAELVMCGDINDEMARDVGKRFDIPYFTENGKILSSKEIDAVFICTPPFTHAPLVIEAAKHQKHVIVEKPMSVSLIEADQMISACREAGVKLSVCYCMRYHPDIQKARLLIEKGILGKVLGVQITFHHDRAENYWYGGYSSRIKTDWRCDPKKSGGGVLAANLVHYIDLVRYLTGLEIEDVYCQYDTLDTPVSVEDSLSLTCLYKNGAIGNISASFCVRGTENFFDFRIWGTDGHLFLASPLRFYSLRSISGYVPCRWHKIKEKRKNERAEFIEHFVSSVFDNLMPPASGEDGRAIQAIIDAAYLSGRLGHAIKV